MNNCFDGNYFIFQNKDFFRFRCTFIVLFHKKDLIHWCLNLDFLKEFWFHLQAHGHYDIVNIQAFF